MYLFTRSTRLGRARIREGTAWAIDITERVNRITELDVSCFTPVFSPAVGTVTWGTIVEDLSVLEAADAKLGVDDQFMEAVERGAALTVDQGADDRLAQIVHGAPDRSRRPQYISVVSAVCANGKFARGIELGIETAQRAEQIGGVPVLFAVEQTGTYGAVRWTTGYETVEQLEATEQAVNGNPEFVEFVDTELADVFLPGSGSQRVVRRLA